MKPHLARRIAQRCAAIRKLRCRPAPAKKSVTKLSLRRRARTIPKFWQRIPLHTLHGSAPLRIYGLVLDSKSIPWIVSASRQLYTPPLYAHKAFFELNAYVQENRPPLVPPFFHPYKNTVWLLGALCLLAAWHGVTIQWWPGTERFFSFAKWSALGSLDVFRVVHLQEWWRCITALTLHSGSLHLFSNCAFGAVFLGLLGRMIGAGPALLGTLMGGVLGNVLNVLYRPMAHNSLGFSTSLFACVGLTASVYAIRNTGKGRIFLPLAAGIGILASLGTGSADGSFDGRTDYAAHIFGLLAGLFLGALYGKLMLRYPSPPLWVRQCCALCAFLIPVAAWCFATGVGLKSP